MAVDETHNDRLSMEDAAALLRSGKANQLRYSIQLTHRFAGIATSSFIQEAESVGWVQQYGTISSTSALFEPAWNRLHKLFLGRLEIVPSALLAVLRRDQSATVYINPQSVVRVRTRKVMSPNDEGRLIMLDEIANVEQVKLTFNSQEIALPEDCGVVFMSCGPTGRKCIFLDARPLLGEPLEDVQYGLAWAHNVVLHDVHDRLDRIDILYKFGWFPFTRIQGALFNALHDSYASQTGIEQAEASIFNLVHRAGEWLAAHSDKARFSRQLPFLREAIEQYQAKKYMASASVLYPRIEGLAKDLGAIGSQRKVVTDLAGNTAGSFLPTQLVEYLNAFLLRPSTDPNDSLPASRHSVAHGVASEAHFNQRLACQLILLFDHLCLGVNEPLTQ